MEKKIEIDGKVYKAVDLVHDWTGWQEEYAIPIVDDFYKALKKTILLSKEGELVENDIVNQIDLLLSFERFKKEYELLALLWINEEEVRFNRATYEERVEVFKSAPKIKADKLREAVPDFFDLIMPSIMAGSASYFQMMAQQSNQNLSVNTA